MEKDIYDYLESLKPEEPDELDLKLIEKIDFLDRGIPFSEFKREVLLKRKKKFGEKRRFRHSKTLQSWATKKLLLLLLLLIFIAVPFSVSAQSAAEADFTPQVEKAIAAFIDRLTALERELPVYTDFGQSTNHFTQRAEIGGDVDFVFNVIDENWTETVHSGNSAIRVEIRAGARGWGGWMFLNGFLPEGETVPRLNTGNEPDAAMNLIGAKELRFYAKGEKGATNLEFFTGGFGYIGKTGPTTVRYPDSAGKFTLIGVELGEAWAEFVIPLDDANLRSIAHGFGFVVPANHDTVFYLDDIRFVGELEAMKSAPILLRSYDTEQPELANTAFSYDNALAAMALLSAGKIAEAERILDAFVYAVENDRYEPGRVRNAYSAGNIAAFPGWESGARLPGWADEETYQWFEDRYQVGSNVGNTAYVALALLQGDAAHENERYLNTARALMDWVLENCSDANPGFTAGLDGWPEGNPPTVYPFTYKSIEHNIDAYAAFKRLYERTGEETYRLGAESALSFIRSMYDETEGVFYTGTGTDGVTIDRDPIVLDAQVWSALALGDEFAPYEKALERVRTMRTSEGGYPFYETNQNGGWWLEGTAYTALMFRLRGDEAAAEDALLAISALQAENGLFPAATVADLATGFELFDGSPWTYGEDLALAPTAWFVMAVNGFNPYGF